MPKKRNKKFFIPLFICLAFLIVGVIGILVPAQTIDFSYTFTVTTYTDFDHSGFDAFITIKNNTDEDLEDVSLTVYYVVNDVGNYFNETATIILDLDQGENGTSFSYKQEGLGIYDLEKIEKITFDYNGTTYEVKQKSSQFLSNWGFIACCVIGFIGSSVSFVLWLTSNKKFVNPAEERLRTFEERIKEAFKPAEPVEKKSERITCHYCKCKFDADKHSKCPNCGAPPEPKD
ncbi:MAG: hypothetical protein IJW32_04295 [Clostridia bacterium]|nr:hypothetical protein [Clostridia bacterium]